MVVNDSFLVGKPIVAGYHPLGTPQMFINRLPSFRLIILPYRSIQKTNRYIIQHYTLSKNLPNIKCIDQALNKIFSRASGWIRSNNYWVSLTHSSNRMAWSWSGKKGSFDAFFWTVENLRGFTTLLSFLSLWYVETWTVNLLAFLVYQYLIQYLFIVSFEDE